MYVEMKHIEKNYGSFHASRDVSFGIDKGKLVALLGPSGSGKTTILRMLAGLENPNSGDIFIDGRRVNDIPAAKRGIGFVFQNYALFHYMTVYDNVAFGLEIQKRPKEEIRQRVLEMIDLVGLSGMEKRYPNQLSGGQRQRVAFARPWRRIPRSCSWMNLCRHRRQGPPGTAQLAQGYNPPRRHYQHLRHPRPGRSRRSGR